MILLGLFLAGLVAGAVNALAGGGPLVTLAALTAAGVDPMIANLTSTVALSPGQIVAGWKGRGDLEALRGAGHRTGPALGLALVGGAAGGGLLLAGGSASFARAVPWLVLVATLIYALSGRGAAHGRRMGALAFAGLAGASAVYGGYFGGGNSFVMLAILGLAGLGAREAAGGKNGMIAAINLGAVAVFVASGKVAWGPALAVGAGGIAGSWAGSALLGRLPTRWLRALIVAFGLALAGWFFLAAGRAEGGGGDAVARHLVVEGLAREH